VRWCNEVVGEVEEKSAKNMKGDYRERKASPSHSLFLFQEKKEGEDAGNTKYLKPKYPTPHFVSVWQYFVPATGACITTQESVLWLRPSQEFTEASLSSKSA